MRKILTVLLCSIILQANAQTYVSGIIGANTTWTKANSPYIVNGNLSVDTIVTLTIEPGVTVRVDTNCFFNIDGKIVAEGTTTDSIIFTANNTNPMPANWPYYWKGLFFRLKTIQDTSKFKNCRFEHAFKSIDFEASNFIITNCLFRYNSVAIFAQINHPLLNNYFVINKCAFTQNGKGLHNRSNKAYGEFTENIVSYSYKGYEDDTEQGLIVHDNSFNYNEIGVHMSSYQKKFSVKGNTFKGNSIYGMTFRNSPTNHPTLSRKTNLPISNNLFIYNDKALQLWDIELCDVKHNTFAYNDIGIDANYSTGITTPYPANLDISHNCFTNNKSYSLKENGTATFAVLNNWWGTTSTTGIDSTIYDYYDNFSSGKIFYSPILSSDTGCQSVPPPPPCANPDSVVAKATSATIVNVTWPAVAGAVAYEYYIIPLPSAPPTSNNITTSTTKVLYGLVPGKTYSVCVRTKCAASPYLSNYVCDTFTMPYVPCNPPANLVVNQVSKTNATISWSTVSNANSYEYYILPHPSTPPSTATATTNTTVFVHSLTPNTTYDICVRSNCGDYSSWSCDTLRTPTSISSNHLDKGISIYPNPNNGTFNISLNSNLVKSAALTVYDITGRVVVAQQNITADETISINDVSKGIYIIRLQSDKAVINRRVIVE